MKTIRPCPVLFIMTDPLKRREQLLLLKQKIDAQIQKATEKYARRQAVKPDQMTTIEEDLENIVNLTEVPAVAVGEEMRDGVHEVGHSRFLAIAQCNTIAL